MSANTNKHSHEYYMARCLALARRGRGATSPNPMVGAILVKDGRIVGRGWHQRAGAAHAEVEAIRDAGPDAAGSTLYVSLEPCNHHGRTGPCTEAVLSAGIREVVVAMGDPNTDVSGGGNRALEKAGVRLTSGVLEDRARRLNASWLSCLESGRSSLTLSLDLSVGGLVLPSASLEQESAASVLRSKKKRNREACDALLVDGETFAHVSGLQREGESRPLVLLDPTLDWARQLRSLKSGNETSSLSLIVSAVEAESELREHLYQQGVGLLHTPDRGDRLNIDSLRSGLHQQGYTSVLCEVSAQMSNYLLACRALDYLLVFRHALHGSVYPEAVALSGIEVAEAKLSLFHTQRLGNSCFSVYDVARCLED